MRKVIGISFVALLVGCQGSGPGDTTRQQQALVCSGSDVPIYTNRFAPQAGASGVATAPEAAAGVISSDAPTGTAGIATGAPVATTAAVPAASGASAPTTPAPTDTGTGVGATATADGGADSGSYTAMVVSCGSAPCAPDQVAVEAPPTVGATGGTGTAATGIAVGGPSAPASGAPVAANTSVAATTTATSAPATTAPATTTPAPSTPPLICTSPPPPCPEGQSPQFTGKQTWECTDCALVVTYGGIYGNYRRCVSMPHIMCPDGQVPTWVYEDEQWECKTKCDNGQYDQHTIEGVMVCVPC